MLRIIAFVLSLFRRTPSQEFVRTFAEPSTNVRVIASSTTYLDGIQAAQEVGQILETLVRPLMADIDAALAMAQEWSQSLPAPVWVPTGAEFDALYPDDASTAFLDEFGSTMPASPIFDRLMADAMPLADVFGPINIAAMVDAGQPAKRVRVYTLASECGVDSKTMRAWLDDEFGIDTKSPSSTVSADEAAAVRTWVATHQDA